MINFLLFFLLILTSCSDKERLNFKGKKIEIHKNTDFTFSESSDVIIGDAKESKFWIQKGYDKVHALSNFSFQFPLKKIRTLDTNQDLSDAYPNFAQPISDNEFLYVLNKTGNLLSIFKKNWKVKWKSKVFFEKKSLPNPGSIVYNPKNYKLYAHNGSNEIIGVNRYSGKIFWRYKHKFPLKGNIAIENNMILVNDYGNNLLSFNNEKLIWKKNLGGSNKSIYSNVRPLIFKNLVINPANDGLFHVLDKENGKFIFSDYLEENKTKVSILLNNDIVANPIIFNNKLFIMSHSGTLAAYKMKNFEVLWKLSIGSSKTPIISGNTMFIIDNENILFALDIRNGKIIWKKELINNIETGYFFKSKKRVSYKGPFLLNNKLLFFSDNNLLNILNPFNGELENTLKFDQIGSAPIFIDNKMILINSDGQLKIYN